MVQSCGLIIIRGDSMADLHFPINGIYMGKNGTQYSYTVYKDMSVKQWPKSDDDECTKHIEKKYGIDVRL